MTKEEAIENLNKFRLLRREEQITEKSHIVEAFRIFWNFQPSETEFASATDGLVMFPEMLYIMVTN